MQVGPRGEQHRERDPRQDHVVRPVARPAARCAVGRVEDVAVAGVRGEAPPEPDEVLQQQATEAALKRARAPRILHIATHGFFLGQQNDHSEQMPNTAGNGRLRTFGLRLSSWAAQIENPLLRSGLALSGANQGGNGDDDGLLTALEMAGLDLWGTKLVVLSACDTGLGTVRNGEGVQGLRRALVLAGSVARAAPCQPASSSSPRSWATTLARQSGARPHQRHPGPGASCSGWIACCRCGRDTKSAWLRWT